MGTSRYLFIGLLFVTTNCLAQTPSAMVKNYFKISAVNGIDEYIIKKAILRITSIGTPISAVPKRLGDLGLTFKNHCRPGDYHPILCDFRISQNADTLKEPNFTVEFQAKDSKVVNVEVRRWYYGRAKTYSTDHIKPGLPKGFQLKDGLELGETISVFEKAYGNWRVSEMGLPGWPIAIIFKYKKKDLMVGLEVGDISWRHVSELKKEKNELRKMKVIAVLYVEK